MQLIVLVMYFLLPYSLAQIPAWGKCPEVKVKQDLDLSRYIGKWYEIQKFPTIYQNKAPNCVRAIYTLRDDGHIKVDNKGYDKNNVSDGVIGDAYNPDSRYPGKLAVRFGEWMAYGPYWVLDTDYENYSFVFSCNDFLFGIGHFESSWILARNRTLPQATVDRLINMAKGYGIKVDEFTITPQTNCPEE